MTTPSTEPKGMKLSALIERCVQETERFFLGRTHEDPYCFELFRRAITENNALAWEGVYTGYSRLVVGWVQEHPKFFQTGEEAPYFVNRAFENMAKSLKKSGAFANFVNLESLLAYLKKCARSVVRDAWRKHEQSPLDLSLEGLPAVDMDVSQQVIQEEQRSELWQRVLARVQGEKERLVIESFFVFGLKPRQIYALYSSVFADILEIHRIKQNLLERLERDPEIQALWQDHA